MPTHLDAPHAVPDTETLRRRALAASWQRDRQVGSRRLAWRWLLWFALRFAMPWAIGLALLWLAFEWPQVESRLGLREPPPEQKPLILKPDTLLHSKEPR